MGSLQEQAFETFGPERQLRALAEELSEAAAAVNRLLNDKGSRPAVMAELVDVESVTKSLRDYLGTEEEWYWMRIEKERRLRLALEKAGATLG